MRAGARLGLALVAVAVALALAAGPAAAHAGLVDANPAPFTRVDTSPSQLVLRFSEKLEDRYTRVEVVDGNDTHYEGDTSIDPDTRTRVTVPVDALPDGVFTVRWRALSVDTHTTSGSYLLAVNATFAGMSTTEQPVDHSGHIQGTASARGWTEALVRAVAFGAGSLALGIPAFLVTLDAGGTLPGRRRLERLAAVAGAVGAIAVVAHLAVIGARTELGLAATAATSTGRAIAARGGLFAVAGALAAVPAWGGGTLRHPALTGAIAAGLGAALATSLSSHAAAAQDLRNAAVLADALHLVAAAVWIGGVVALLVACHGNAGAARLRELVTRFSRMATGAVLVLVATGTFAAWLHLGEPGDLFRSSYGWALTAKAALTLPLVGVGWLNSRIMVQRMAWNTSPTDDRRTLRRLVAAETIIFAVVLVAAGVLANTAPPSAPAVVEGAADEDGRLEGVVHQFDADGFNVTVAVTPEPVRVGFQTVTVVVDPGDGAMPDNAAVGLSLHPPSDRGGEGHTIRLDRLDNRTWQVRGPTFTEHGQWRVDVFLQGRGTFVIDEFALDVASA